jgi:hypothetical protein
MGSCKTIPLLLVAFYAFCTVCPERLIPASALQKAASEAHDCHKGDRHKPLSECRTAFSESLPSSTVKFSHALTVYTLLFPQDVFSLAFDLLLRPRTTHFSTAGPSLASLTINLRI